MCAYANILSVCVRARTYVCVGVRVFAFIYHEMCVNSSKKANLYEIVYLFNNAFFYISPNFLE